MARGAHPAALLLEVTIFPSALPRAHRRCIPTGLRLAADDGSSELNLNLESWLDFGYGDTRKPDAGGEFEGLLVIFFRLGAEEGDTDTITLAEIVTLG